MRNYSLSHLSDAALRRDLKEQSRKETGLTAWVLAHIAEFQERRLYREDGYASMYAWCVGELGYCEQAAYKRINAARVALRFPVIFAMLAEGRLTLSAVVALSAHLIESNAEDLLAAAAAKTVREIEQLLAERFPRPDLATVIQSLAPASSPAPDLDQRHTARAAALGAPDHDRPGDARSLASRTRSSGA
ncbi:MAG: hypothetical protein HY076_04630 [Candidatus Eisenbacteria bacterium]|uniref:DUF222 domain-containing protein n=1 Tax=Eiseniibacteriota bacterium TaxID=2212470 RepID=A0A9D6L6J4_UNCEI|nr:hypothetical protein [Candidatus Eisenbacteria bacterium]